MVVELTSLSYPPWQWNVPTSLSISRGLRPILDSVCWWTVPVETPPRGWGFRLSATAEGTLLMVHNGKNPILKTVDLVIPPERFVN